MIKKRYIEQEITDIAFAGSKMAFISGPRQCGKTTMAKHLLSKRGIGSYYNWDELKFRKLWTKDPSDIIPINQQTKTPLVVLDEIHKAKFWKRNLKGVYDSLSSPCDILVTGSVHLNSYRKGSDSLLGRYYLFHLHPFSLAELLSEPLVFEPTSFVSNLFCNESTGNLEHERLLKTLDQFGPFPEPLFSQNERILNLWQQGRLEKLIREDLRDLSRIPELSQIEMLVSLLPERASNIFSIQSLSEGLEVAYTTVKNWMRYLEALYYCYEIKPYFKSLKRTLKKATKLYLWDWSEIEDEGARFENLIASHLLKFCDYLTDTGVGQYTLCYLRNRNKQEIDFLIVKDNQPWLPIEAKLSQETLSKNWAPFIAELPCKRGIQVVKTPGVFKKITTEYGEILVISAEMFLAKLV